jgi:hypothetical protein
MYCSIIMYGEMLGSSRVRALTGSKTKVRIECDGKDRTLAYEFALFTTSSIKMTRLGSRS